MKFVNKSLSTEKITTINLAKIIHQVITSIDLRVLHTIIITAALIIINLTSCSLVKLVSSFYPINSKEKTPSNCIN
jgi:uncharacterized membrane protein YcaP (DUF421 family)